MMKVIEMVRTNDDQWHYGMKYHEFKNFKEFTKYTNEELRKSKNDKLHRNYWLIKNHTLSKILYINEGMYYTL